MALKVSSELPEGTYRILSGFGGKNINFNTNNLDYLNFGLKWEQSFLEWKISEIRVYLCKFYYSAICTMEVS